MQTCAHAMLASSVSMSSYAFWSVDLEGMSSLCLSSSLALIFLIPSLSWGSFPEFLGEELERTHLKLYVPRHHRVVSGCMSLYFFSSVARERVFNRG